MASPPVLTDYSNPLTTPLNPSLHNTAAILRHNLRISSTGLRRLPRALIVRASISRRQLIAHTAAAVFIAPFTGVSPSKAAGELFPTWERPYLPIDPGAALLHIAFVPDDPNHGTRHTIFETKDGGNTWAPIYIPSGMEEEFNYQVNAISIRGKEGWIVGKPTILLYSSDAGENWELLPLSSQLPGEMERPRFFDLEARKMCWANAETVPGRDPGRWRKDAAGNIVGKRFHSCQGCLCFEYDHIIPFSKGGQSVAENCQILQTKVNRFKADKVDVDKVQLKGYSCGIDFSDKELDLIEMAVYGDIMRPGNQCRVATIDEMVGLYKSKNRIATCNSLKDLTYKGILNSNR